MSYIVVVKNKYGDIEETFVCHSEESAAAYCLAINTDVSIFYDPDYASINANIVVLIQQNNFIEGHSKFMEFASECASVEDNNRFANYFEDISLEEKINKIDEAKNLLKNSAYFDRQ